jgi:hypothetical protein
MIGMTEMVGWFEAKVDGCCFLKTPCGVRDESLWGLGWCISILQVNICMYIDLKVALEEEFKKRIGMDVAAWEACNLR